MKRILSFVLAFSIILNFAPAFHVNTSAAAQYNVDAALQYAKNHWNDGKGQCAEFVSDCLTAGGINVSIKTTRSLRNYLVNNGYATDYFITSKQSTRVKMSDYPGKITVGDIIINYCGTCDVYPHVMFVSGTNSSGQITYYAHHEPANNKAYWNGSDGYKSHPGHAFDMHVLHMNNSVSGGTTQQPTYTPVPVHTHLFTTQTNSYHPHNRYNVCSCGTKESLGTTTSSSCQQCYPLGSVSLTRTFNKTGKTATFYRNDVVNATNYTLTLYRKDLSGGSFSIYDLYNMSGSIKNVYNLDSGIYYAKLTVNNSSTGQEKSTTCEEFKIVNTYTVSYNANGGKNTPLSQTKIQDENLTLTSQTPSRDHYIFKGWARSKNATVAEYQPGDTYTKNAKVTLYAVWEPETYTIKFDANGGKGEIEDITITYGDVIRIPNDVICDYSYLKGWSTGKTATTASYKIGMDYKFDANTTLYAVWGTSTWSGGVSTSLSGSGAEADPYLIQSEADLGYLANKVNSQTSAPQYEYYKLTDNINLAYNEWIPIGLYGNENQYFYGSFDGNGFTISDLYITKESEKNIGLFGYAKNSEIKNLTVTGAIESITSSNALNIGSIVGYSTNTSLKNLNTMYFNIGSISVGTADYTRMGTIAGYVSEGSVSDCISTDCHIDLKSGNFEVGMIVGCCNAYITDCSAKAASGGLFSTQTTVGAFRLGGLCGNLSANAERCSVYAPYFSNNIKTTADSSVGGLVGYLDGEVKVCSSQFSDDEANSITMSGTGSTEIGGITGFATSKAKITDCKFDGNSVSSTTTSGSTAVGGLVGSAQAKSNPTVSVNGGQSLSKAELPTKEGCKATWYIDAAMTVPYDFSQTVTSDMTLYAKWEEGDDTPDIWDGTSKEPSYNADTKTYTITNGEELAWVSDVTNGVITSGENFPTDITFSGYTIELANDIYLNDTTNWGNWSVSKPNNEWYSIGASKTRFFSGTLNGNHNSIFGMYIDAYDYDGFIKYANNATIKNILFEKSFVTGSRFTAGTVVGIADGTTIDGVVSYTNIIGDSDNTQLAGGIVFECVNSNIKNCVNYGNINCDGSAGIAYSLNESEIFGCNNYGDITADAYEYAAGIVSDDSASNSKISYCNNYGNIIGEHISGGIVGDFGRGSESIKYCSNFGNVTGKDLAGGIVGSIFLDADGNIVLSQNMGTIEGSTAGGIVGGYSSYSYYFESDDTEIYRCYNRGKIKGSSTGGGIAGSLHTMAGDVFITECYNQGTVSADEYAAGIVGMIKGMNEDWWSRYGKNFNFYIDECYSKQKLYNNDEYSLEYLSCEDSSVVTQTTMKTLSNLTGFPTTIWTTNSSINAGYPYVKSLEETYKTYKITTIVDTDNSAINRSFANVNGSITGNGSSNAMVGGILGSASGSSGANSVAQNVISIVDGISSSHKAGNIVANNSGYFTFNNAYYNTEMNIASSTNAIDTTGTARSEISMNVPFYINLLGLTPYTSIANVKNDSKAVWVLKNGELPELYYNCLNDITISSEIVNGSVEVDKTQAVDGEVVVVTATPDDGYVLNKVYVNGIEQDGETFIVKGDSDIYVTFAEKIQEYDVTVESTENATGSLANADFVGPVLMSLSGEEVTSILANDGEEIQVTATADEDHTVDAIYVNGEEIVGNSFILTGDSVVTMDVTSISTDYTATTNEADSVGVYHATLSGSVAEFDGASRYIRYWMTDEPETIYTTEVQEGGGLYSADVTGLESNTEYAFQMTENGEIKTFLTLGDVEMSEEFGDDILLGDVNADGVININDVVLIVEYIGTVSSGGSLDEENFPNGTFPAGEKAALLTSDDIITVNDVVLLVEYIVTKAKGGTLNESNFPNGNFPRAEQ